jgi:hypothetical protein
MSIVADAADGVDGVMGSVLTHGRYPDCPRSQPALTAEDNLNSECAEEALCPAPSASERAGIFGPAGSVTRYPISAAFGASTQKIGGGPGPRPALRHDLPHASGDWVGMDFGSARTARTSQTASRSEPCQRR